jgi:hypothetical protein
MSKVKAQGAYEIQSGRTLRERAAVPTEVGGSGWHAVMLMAVGVLVGLLGGMGAGKAAHGISW